MTLKRWMAQSILLAGLIAVAAMTVLAVWPVPAKYPWLLPIVVALGAAYSLYRRQLHADHEMPYIVGLGIIIAFSAMTLFDWQKRFDIPGAIVGAVVVALALLAFGAFLLLLVASGGASDPYDDD